MKPLALRADGFIVGGCLLPRGFAPSTPPGDMLSPGPLASELVWVVGSLAGLALVVVARRFCAVAALGQHRRRRAA